MIDNDKMWASVIKRFYIVHNIDRNIFTCFLEDALTEQGLRLNDNFELERIEEIKGNQGGISPKFKIGDTIRLKGSQVEYTIESISEGFYHCGGCDAGIECADTEFVLVEPKLSNVERTGKDCKELTELEEAIAQTVTNYAFLPQDIHHRIDRQVTLQFYKDAANKLLSIARKQIAQEIMNGKED